MDNQIFDWVKKYSVRDLLSREKLVECKNISFYIQTGINLMNADSIVH